MSWSEHLFFKCKIFWLKCLLELETIFFALTGFYFFGMWQLCLWAHLFGCFFFSISIFQWSRGNTNQNNKIIKEWNFIFHTLLILCWKILLYRFCWQKNKTFVDNSVQNAVYNLQSCDILHRFLRTTSHFWTSRKSALWKNVWKIPRSDQKLDIENWTFILIMLTYKMLVKTFFKFFLKLNI